MIITTLPTKSAISEIVSDYRLLNSENKKLISLRKFAFLLSQFLEPLGGKITHQSIKNWQDRKNLPNTFHMVQLSQHANGWQQEFALDILSALHPETYKPITSIGKCAVKKYGIVWETRGR